MITGISVLVALSLGAVLVATTSAVTTRSLERTSTDLDAARSAFYRLKDDRAQFAAAQAALVTALPVFRAHMSDSRLAGDVATLDAMGEGYRRQLKADFCIVADRDERWTSKPGWPAGVDPSDAILTSIPEATAGRPHRAIANLGDHLFLIVSEPARFAEEVLGTLTVGLALDDAVARRLAEVAHADVNLIAGRQLSASSLTGTDRLALAGLVSAPGWLSQPGTLDTVQRVGDGQYSHWNLSVVALATTAARSDAWCCSRTGVRHRCLSTRCAAAWSRPVPPSSYWLWAAVCSSADT